MLAINLTKDIEDRLDILAKRTHRTKTFYAKEAILTYLEDLEDLYLAEDSLKRLATGKSKTISIDEMENRCNNVEH
jgi:RHH-type rel operon transcriptional repressor/antitoxin RelB